MAGIGDLKPLSPTVAVPPVAPAGDRKPQPKPKPQPTSSSEDDKQEDDDQTPHIDEYA